MWIRSWFIQARSKADATRKKNTVSSKNKATRINTYST
jgi:hypothetical protein